MKKLIILLILLYAFDVSGAEIKKTIHEDGGGDYTTLEACMDANEQDLTDATPDHFIAEIDEAWTGADTTAVDIDLWTTAAASYIQIYTTAAARHNGTYDATSAYALDTASGTVGIDIDENYVRIIGLQIEVDGATSGIDMTNVAGTADIRISHCVIRGNVHDDWNAQNGIADTSFNTGLTKRIHNNIIYDMITNNDADKSVGIYYGKSTTTYIYANTITDCGVAINMGERDVECINNIIQNATAGTVDFEAASGGTLNANSGHNITEIAANVENADGASWSTGNSTDGDGSGSGQLIDSSEDFSSVILGSIVSYGAGPSYTYVTDLTSAASGTLGVNTGIGNTTAYTIYKNIYSTGVAFENEGGNDFHLGSGDTVAAANGQDLDGNGNIAVTDDIDGDTRDANNPDIGADELAAGVTYPKQVI